ncbi:MAG TPA: GNAT family N-acetyltransferase [Chitinophagaceae bacterium]|nr:GNAT family N-acetyltransferase [Chitinophagaceae bacterium]
MQPNHILAAGPDDVIIISDLGKQTFLESHGHSAPAADIAAYVSEKYDPEIIKAELSDPDNIYRIIYAGDQPAGFSKIILNSAGANIPLAPVAKLERIYLLNEFHGLGLGKALLQHNTAIATAARQKGIWLYVWVENKKAFQFYTQQGFRIVGQYDFRISPTHTNPNHQMLLSF